jgi:hypothetical protein
MDTYIHPGDGTAGGPAKSTAKRQHRTVAEKRRIVEETLVEGASVARIARSKEIAARKKIARRRRIYRFIFACATGVSVPASVPGKPRRCLRSVVLEYALPLRMIT